MKAKRESLGWVVNATRRPLYPQERYLIPTVQEAAWASGPENITPTGIWSPDNSACSKSLYLLGYPSLQEGGSKKQIKKKDIVTSYLIRILHVTLLGKSHQAEWQGQACSM